MNEKTPPGMLIQVSRPQKKYDLRVWKGNSGSITHQPVTNY